MKLSEAIRDGAKIRPQKIGRMFGFTAGDAYGSCALGGAFECAFGNMHFDEFHMQRALFEKFPVLGQFERTPVNDGAALRTVRASIIELNDVHGWSREAIAEWVETIENKLAMETAGEVPIGGELASPAVPEKTQEVYPVVSTLA